MPTPAYCYINEGDPEGSVEIAGREGSIEVINFDHNVHIPVDIHSGRASGVRTHKPAVITKAYDKSSPYLAKALCNGETFDTVKVMWYEIDDLGDEVNYFTHLFEKVRVSDIRSFSPNAKDPDMEHFTHMEEISFVYQRVTWTFEDGALTYTDDWVAER